MPPGSTNASFSAQKGLRVGAGGRVNSMPGTKMHGRIVGMPLDTAACQL